MFGIGTTELMIILGIVVVLFGARRLPELGSGVGKAIRNFKINNDEMSQLIVQVDLEKKKLEDVVAAWIKDNEARWKAWLQ